MYWNLKPLPNIENQKVIHEFLLELKRANKSKSTITEYRNRLRFLFKETDEPFYTITMDKIQDWLTKDSPKSERTIQNYMGVLRVFFNFCKKEGYIEQSPILNNKRLSKADMYWELKQSLPNRENQETIQAYLLSLKSAEKKRNTIEDIRIKLQVFFRDWEKAFSEITRVEIKGWFNQKGKQWSERTEENYRNVLSSFYKYCLEEGYLDNSPFKEKTVQHSAKKYWELKRTLANKENQDTINAYLLNLKSNRFSKGTIEGRKFFLQLFFLDQKSSLSLLTADHIQRWFDEHQKNKKKSTMKSYRSYLRSFYNFCLTEGYTEQSPIAELDKRKLNAADEYWIVKHSLPNAETENVICAYLTDLKSAGKDRKEIIYKRNILGLFFESWEKSFSSITNHDIRNWFDKYKVGRSKKTISSYKSVLRSFYSFCKRDGYINNPPVKRKRWVKLAEKYWEIQQPLENKQNRDIINEFLLHLKNQNRSKSVVESYRFHLQYFFRERRDSFSVLTPDDVKQWIKEQQEVGKGKDYSRRLMFVRVFYRYCIRQEYVKQQPVLYHWEREGNQAVEWKLQENLPNKENQCVINEFLLSMKVAYMSEETMKGYRLFLQQFFRDREESFDNLEPDAIQKWFIERQNKWKKSTIANYLGVLSSFYNFCVDDGYIERSPIKSRWFPRLPQPVPKYLEKEEIAKVRLQAEKNTLRNQAIVEFLLVTGCRIGEVYGLNRTDVDLENRTATVLGKGKRIRTVHFTEKSALLLERYLQSRQDNDPALFLSERENRFGIAGMQFVVRKMGKQALLNNSLHPHRFRHTFATELLAKGADLSFIADELGHKNLGTTQVYARLPNSELISMYRKFMG